MTTIIKVLGPGCRNCVILDRVTREAVFEHVLLAGRVPTLTARRHLLTAATQPQP